MLLVLVGPARRIVAQHFAAGSIPDDRVGQSLGHALGGDTPPLLRKIDFAPDRLSQLNLGAGKRAVPIDAKRFPAGRRSRRSREAVRRRAWVPGWPCDA